MGAIDAERIVGAMTDLEDRRVSIPLWALEEVLSLAQCAAREMPMTQMTGKRLESAFAACHGAAVTRASHLCVCGHERREHDDGWSGLCYADGCHCMTFERSVNDAPEKPTTPSS